MIKDRSTKTLTSFLLTCGGYAIAAFIWYRNLLFRCMPGMTYSQSRLLLSGMMVGCILLGAFVLFRRRRTDWTALVCLLLPCGFYTMLTYRTVLGRLPAAVFAAAGLLTAGNALHVLTGKIRSADRRRVLHNRLYHCCCAAHSFLAAGMAVILLTLIGRAMFGTALVQPSVEAQTGIAEQVTQGNTDILLRLQPGEWQELEVKEKLDVLQTVANIEANRLGLPNELNVGGSNLSDGTLGSYDDRMHAIHINLELLETGSPDEALRSCCHEVYHSYQYRLVEAREAAGEELAGLRLFRSAAEYAEEFADYESGGSGEEFYAYYAQHCEEDARAYAEEAVQRYDQMLEEMLASRQNE